MRTLLIICLSLFAISAQAQNQIEILLTPGFNMMSINIAPPQEMFREGEDRGPDVRLMFDQLQGEDGVHLAQVITGADGRFYAPNWQFCNLPFWEITQGLRILVLEDVIVRWEGERIEPNADIPLISGGNLAAYYPQYDLNANAGEFYALSPIIDNVIIAKDERGMFLMPEYNFSNMNPWSEGEAYYIRVAEDVILNYPEERIEEPVLFDEGDHWSIPVMTDLNMSILVTSIEGPEDFEPGEGDQIGVFSIFGEFVGYGNVQNGRAGLTVLQENGNLRDIPGLDWQDTMTLVYWDEDDESEYEIEVTEVLEGNGLEFVCHRPSVFEIFVEVENEQGIREQRVLLENGWNLISLNIEPIEEMWEIEEGPDIEIMMEELFGMDLLEMMKDEDGRFYSPEFRFNNIPFWNLTEGYQVNIAEDTEVTWSGCPIPPDTEIPIEEGWNLIAYFPDFRAEDFYALSAIIDNVLIAKNGDGDFMTPQFGFSNMPPWEPGQGYQVNVDAEVVLHYPEECEEEDAAHTPIASHWTGISPTDNNMSLLVTSISGIDPAPGSQIAAYTSDGLMVGVGDVQNDKCGIAIWGAETGKSGLQSEDKFELRFWDADQRAETDLIISTIRTGTGLVYEVNGLSVIDVAITVTPPDNYFLTEAYPNPFNNRTTVKYGLPETGLVNLTIFDLSGRKMMELVNGEQSAGTHEMDIDCNDLTSGIYMLSLNAGRMNFTQRLVLVK